MTPAADFRSTDFPMPGIVASYGDELVRTALTSLTEIDEVPIARRIASETLPQPQSTWVCS
ncbi:hypothetical protein OG280_37375 [Streptomyces virginiae]|uniref:hypothetical protein n=1 Tax=Streptomyces virginiae TaxID=1961 RepID=UPI00324E18AA